MANYKYTLLPSSKAAANEPFARPLWQKLLMFGLFAGCLCVLTFFSTYLPKGQLLTQSNVIGVTTIAPEVTKSQPRLSTVNHTGSTTTHKVYTSTHAVSTTTPKVSTTTQKVSTSTHKVPTTTQKVPTTTHAVSTSTHKVSTTIHPVVNFNPTVPTITHTVSTINRTVPKYFVYGPHCRMPYVNPFAPEARKIYHPKNPAKCASDNGALISVVYDSNRQQYLLHLNSNFTRQYANSSIDLLATDPVGCCYSEIVRSGSGKGADKNYKLLPCTNFHQDFTVPLHIDAMIVDCKLRTTDKTVQQDAFSFIQPRNGTGNITQKPKVISKRKPGVLLIGIDSLSRINFRRTMPMTFNYLRDNNWFELQGYNKVGDNTFPNLMAVLTGYNESYAYAECKPKFVGGLDDCDFIWKHYKNLSYYTAYAEDTVSISTFNYLKLGFRDPPTDYYLRPMLLAAEKKMKVTKRSLPFCIGRKQYGEYVYDYALEFAKRYSNEPTFGLFWTNSFSHNYFDMPSTMDQRMLAYFKSFKSEGMLENSIVIFLSDHGMRFGSLLGLSQGFMEERLPMFFMSLPDWFKKQYPDLVTALEINRNRLTSPYDIHMTLKHILKLSDPNLKLPPTNGCATCQTVFAEVPKNRTCTDAGIPEHWCTCVPYETVNTKKAIVKTVTNAIIDEMNRYVIGRGFEPLCQPLELNSVENAQLKLEEEEQDEERTSHTYRIKFITNPGKASFQATAVFNVNSKSVSVSMEDISRLNSYEKNAACIYEKEMKKYCICY